MIRRLPSFFIASRDSERHSGDADTSSPPPPYTDSTAPPFLLAETKTTRTQVITTTTKTTTETTTNVLPIVDCYAGTYSTRSGTDDRQDSSHGASSSGFPVLDKALPPTPCSPSVSFDFSRPTNLSHIKSSACPSRSISDLGRTSLGLGLTAIPGSELLNQSTLSPDTQFSFPLLPPGSEQQSPPPLRKTKSTQKLSRFSHLPPEDVLRRRSRGISFGAVSWLALATVDIKGKGKEKGTEKTAETPSAIQDLPSQGPKTVSRRSSFWSRQKKHDTDFPKAEERSEEALPPIPPQVPALPRLNFDFDLPEPERTSAPSLLQPPRPPLTPRCHSENALLDSAIAKVEAVSSLAADDGGYISPILKSPSLPFHVSDLVSDGSGHNTAGSSGSLRPPRPRAQTNPPLLHRLSTALFSFSDNPVIHDSPKQSVSSHSIPTSQRNIPKPSDNTESPGVYVSRLRSVVSKAEMAGILASSSDPFYVNALRCYLHQFDFRDEPLDIALRKLLMEVGLPRETQQIDRVMEAFSTRYSECNPSLFASDDHGYVLAFSLIMLHTDAFNPSNKNKMSKPDYIKNTALAGLPSEVLGCYYDNIVFAPFIFIEDALDINGQFGLPNHASQKPRTPSTPSNTGILGKNKIDPYYLISNNLLTSMQGEVELHVPLEGPFSYNGVGSHSWSDEELHQAFSSAGVIEVEQSTSRPLFASSASSESIPEDFRHEGSPNPHLEGPSQGPLMTIKVTKIGVLNRKDDIGVRGKRVAFRKWRLWTVLLTGSQLLFFRDPSLAAAVLDRLGTTPEDSGGDFLLGSNLLKPDEILSVKDTIAVYDKTYKKHKNTLRFALSNGRQILLQAPSTDDTDEWLTKINYASAFKSAGVRIRPLGMSPDEMQMTGVAAATSLLHDVQYGGDSGATPVQPWDSSISRDLMGMLSADSFTQRPTPRHRLALGPGRDVDLDSTSVLDAATCEQFEATFKTVKANLAQESPCLSGRISFDSASSPTTLGSSPPLTRSDIIRRKVEDLKTKLVATQSQLDNDLRFVRNIAILKPFQAATRSRLLNPVQNVARKVMLLRLEVVRLQCHLSVLQRDLEAETRSMDRIQNIALEAAKQSLDGGPSSSIPRMTISPHDTEDHTDGLSPSAFSESWSNSSTSESFRSALEYRSDWPAEETSPFLAPSQVFGSPRPSLSPASTPSPNESRNSVFQRSASYSSSMGGSPKEPVPAAIPGDDVPEEAEVWNKTRCAQRVSLIRVPSTISFTHHRPDGRN